jgi:hypothetical protein
VKAKAVRAVAPQFAAALADKVVAHSVSYPRNNVKASAAKIATLMGRFHGAVKRAKTPTA